VSGAVALLIVVWLVAAIVTLLVSIATAGDRRAARLRALLRDGTPAHHVAPRADLDEYGRAGWR
jgi:hypothetical protein